MVDWSIFGVDLLAAFLSSIIILVIGWGIAWKLIHSYQRRNTEIQNNNNLINEISFFKSALQKTTDAWLTCQREDSNRNFWFIARSKLLDIGVQRETLYVRILNQYPDYIAREFETVITEGKRMKFTFQTIAESFKEYKKLYSDSMIDEDFSNDNRSEIIKKESEVSHYLSIVLLELIKEPLSKAVKDKIREIEKRK